MASRLSASQRIFRLVLPSDPHKVHEVEQFLTRVNRSAELEDEKFHMLLVAVTEAVNNAIAHGNRKDKAKRVHITCTATKRSVAVSVRDEGEGFNPSILPDPLHADNLLRDSGRGVFLMRQLVDSVTYNQKGTTVTLRMRR